MIPIADAYGGGVSIYGGTFSDEYTSDIVGQVDTFCKNFRKLIKEVDKID